MPRAARFLFLASFAALAGGLAAQPRPLADADARALITVVGDSLARALRSEGREHLYLLFTVDCGPVTPCTPEAGALARSAFASSAVAAIVRAGQRWSTVCDNSEQLTLRFPVTTGDSTYLTVVASRFVKGAAYRQLDVHSLALVKSAGTWKVVAHHREPEQFEAVDPALQPVCNWSPTLDAASNPLERIGLAASGDRPTVVSTDESCPLCRLRLLPLLKLGTDADRQFPHEFAPVFSNRRGRYYVEGTSPGRILMYDSTGALLASEGENGSRDGEFRSIDKIFVDATDSVYVLDNSNRRISVLTPELRFARSLSLGTTVSDFVVLRDGRILVTRPQSGSFAPVAILSSTGATIRESAAREPASMSSCARCNIPLISVAPSGYRFWLVWPDRYRIEEWDLSGRRIRTLERPLSSMSLAPRRMADQLSVVAPALSQGAVDEQPGIQRLLAARDGTLWVSLVARGPGDRSVHMIDVIDAGTGRLVRSIAGENLAGLVEDGVRTVRRLDANGFPELLLERFALGR